MFYSEVILTRRGPLAKVWLAAHYERKLSKTQTLQTDITESVGAYLMNDTCHRFDPIVCSYRRYYGSGCCTYGLASQWSASFGSREDIQQEDKIPTGRL
jgi:hypothetical protein